MGIWETSPRHNLSADLKLVSINIAGFAVTAAMKVVSEIIGVGSLIGLNIISKKNNPDVPAAIQKRLDNKRIGNVVE